MFGGGRAAGTLPSLGESDDSVVDPGTATYLKRALLRLLRLDGETAGLAELTAAAVWTGIMGYSRDNHPWVGNVPGQHGLWLCAGYTGHGMPNGTLCAKAVVDMLLGALQGEELAALCERMVSQGAIPRSYLLTRERVQKARALLTVQQQEESGVHRTGVV